MAIDTTQESSSGPLGEAREKGSEVVSAAQEQLEAKTAELRDDAAFRLKDQIDQRSLQAAEQVKAVGGALRSGTEQLRAEGRTSSATAVERIARRADDLGAYLESTDADRILADVESFVRRRPWLVAGAAAVAGFAASRLVKASSDRRYELTSSDRRYELAQS